MRHLLQVSFIAFALILGLLAFSQNSYADVWEAKENSIQKSGVWIPEDEYFGYFDANGIYTVVGAIKNFEEFPIIPTIVITIQDGDKIISRSLEYVAILPTKELPFKVKFPEVTSKLPILKNPSITYVPTQKEPLNVEVIYDDTLVQHEDGHLTGRIINNGYSTVYNIKVFAIIHGYEEALDMGQNIEMIEKMEPGQIRKFSMYPDTSISDKVFYYSCFAPTDSTVMPITTKKNEGDFDFRYDSGSWYYAAKFNEEGTILTMNGYNSYPLATYANFEFSPISGEEKFEVFFNDEPVEFIQSVDEMGNWHVAFSVEPRSQGNLVISGFEKGLPPERSLIPDWLKTNADWWSRDQISDVEFLEGIKFLLDKGVIIVPAKGFAAIGNWEIPHWIKTTAGWWSEDKIDDDSFLLGIQYLIQNGVIVV